MRSRIVGAALVGLCALSTVSRADAQPAVLVVGHGHGADLAWWPLPRKLSEEHGFVVGSMPLGDVTPDLLAEFNVVVLTGLSRIDPSLAAGGDTDNMSLGRFEELAEDLLDYVEAGGGLYVYGANENHANSRRSHDATVQFLERVGARMEFEQLRDPPRERRQQDGLRIGYALAATIADHPATTSVSHYWYPVDLFNHGPWTKALRLLDPNWVPLIRTSEAFQSFALDDAALPNPVPPEVQPSLVPLPPPGAPIYAARELGLGRIVANGGESMLSFFDYDFSEYVNQQTGKIGMEAGLVHPEGGAVVPSDGLQLLVSSLAWLAEPTLESGAFGGYTLPPRTPQESAPSRLWEPPPLELPADRYARGVVGAMPVGAGGVGAIDEYVEVATDVGLDFLVVTADFETLHGGRDEAIARADWDALVDACDQATTPALLVVPAMLTRDEQGNRFVVAGRAAWPAPSLRSSRVPLRVRDHLAYWLHDANGAFRAPYLFGDGHYPPELFSAYNAFAVQTWLDGVLIDEAFDGFLRNNAAGDHVRPFIMALTTEPEQLHDVSAFTWIRADTRQQLAAHFYANTSDARLAWISSGPRIEFWSGDFLSRYTDTQPHVPGRERFILALRASSDVGLRRVLLYDRGVPWRRFELAGEHEVVRTVAGLHDGRHDFVAVVEDLNGDRAVTGDIETNDLLFRQFILGDRCNYAYGAAQVREAEGARWVYVPASSYVYKAGRLAFATPWWGEEIPGVDGAGSISHLNYFARPFLFAAPGGGRSETRRAVHEIIRAYESADAIIFDTPIIRRCRDADCGCSDPICAVKYGDVYGHAPYVDLAEPAAGARLTMYSFVRQPFAPSASFIDVEVVVTDPAGVQLGTNGLGLSIEYFEQNTTAEVTRHIVLRADGTQEANPPAGVPCGVNYGETWCRPILHPGDGLLFPDQREALFVLDGDVAASTAYGQDGYFRLHLGRADTPFLAANERSAARLLQLKTATTDPRTFVESATAFRDAFGLAGEPPSYTVEATRGAVVSTRYLLKLAAHDGAFEGVITTHDLPQRLPVQVTGLDSRWTVAKIDLEREEWLPLGLWEGSAFTTVDADREHHLFIGNVVRADAEGVSVTLLPDNQDGRVYAEVHNPTADSANVRVRVAVSSFLGAAQTLCPVHVAAGTSVRVVVPADLEADIDSDAIPDRCDDDDDNDGVPNDRDHCPSEPGEAVDADGCPRDGAVGPPDAIVDDPGVLDASALDGAAPDAGPDAGRSANNGTADAGAPEFDAGGSDEGVRDARVADEGPGQDATASDGSSPLDAGETDGTLRPDVNAPDAGSPPDLSTADGRVARDDGPVDDGTRGDVAVDDAGDSPPDHGAAALDAGLMPGPEAGQAPDGTPAAAPSGGSDGGCDCRLGGASPAVPMLLTLLIPLWCALRRSRNRRGRARTSGA